MLLLNNPQDECHVGQKTNKSFRIPPCVDYCRRFGQLKTNSQKKKEKSSKVSLSLYFPGNKYVTKVVLISKAPPSTTACLQAVKPMYPPCLHRVFKGCKESKTSCFTFVTRQVNVSYPPPNSSKTSCFTSRTARQSYHSTGSHLRFDAAKRWEKPMIYKNKPNFTPKSDAFQKSTTSARLYLSECYRESDTFLVNFTKKKPLHQSTMLFSCDLDKMQSLRPTLRIKSSGCRRKW